MMINVETGLRPFEVQVEGRQAEQVMATDGWTAMFRFAGLHRFRDEKIRDVKLYDPTQGTCRWWSMIGKKFAFASPTTEPGKLQGLIWESLA